MATDTTVHEGVEHQEKADWSGAKAPFKASYGKLMMWYFLLSDAFTFAGFLIAYGALRMAMPTWPVPDFVFSKVPFFDHANAPLIFVTFMTFVLLFSSYTMVRAVQEGHREYKSGVVFWMTLTVIGGAGFLGCQAWEWHTLIVKESMTLTTNPFGTHIEYGTYLGDDGKPSGDTFEPGDSYLIHNLSAHHGDEGHDDHHADDNGHGADGHSDDHGHGASSHLETGDFADKYIDESGYIHRKYLVTDGKAKGERKFEAFGPKAFGALFFFITGFHGFHVLSGVAFLLIILLNVMSGLYIKRKNGYEMVEKIGLYWHFVDLVWVFVFLVFYLL